MKRCEKQARSGWHPQRSTAESPVCLFCEKRASQSEPLHEAMTKQLDERVKRCATKLRDVKLFAKVSSCDLVASEGKHHTNCLVGFYNATRKAETFQ